MPSKINTKKNNDVIARHQERMKGREKFSRWLKGESSNSKRSGRKKEIFVKIPKWFIYLSIITIMLVGYYISIEIKHSVYYKYINPQMYFIPSNMVAKLESKDSNITIERKYKKIDSNNYQIIEIYGSSSTVANFYIDSSAIYKIINGQKTYWLPVKLRAGDIVMNGEYKVMSIKDRIHLFLGEIGPCYKVKNIATDLLQIFCENYGLVYSTNLDFSLISISNLR